ncbi:MAG TPA: ATP-binding protein [Dokdonella sp.]|uniref:ATP-binding response regulator n=1 Tax=Dokdonella sp. TaxID=2291710 RepID=UPI002D7E1F33|nr:ATP-binding protein [Dokdonella sp.]HET9032169.1 ATP-binding protein [Dokdonella sp.]
MNSTSDSMDFSSDRYQRIARALFERAQPLLLEFDNHWRLIDLHGDAARFGFDVDNAEVAARQLQDLFLGMPLDQSIDLPFVEMPNGRSTHVQLLGADDGFQVLLLDAQAEHERQQTQQQTGNEAALVSYQKTKAINQLRQIRSELEQQRVRLQEANALKNALIATLSHDFRTPLTSIFGYVHLLEEESGQSVSTQHGLRALRRNANYLFTLAENLLEYARADTRSSLLAPVAIDLADVVEDLQGMFEPMARDQGLEFSIELKMIDATPALLDELRLRQILVNLISNAIRYTAKGWVKVHLLWNDKTLSIEVSDSGIGIAEEFQEKIFVAFSRIAQAPGSGAGLGLSIVKRLVKQMLGTLELQSTLGQGSSFRIVLPNLDKSVAGELEKPAEPLFPNSGRGRSVLVVDDDPDITFLLEALLTDMEFQVRVVGDAGAAVENALANPPDILLVDVELPGLSGNTAVFRLRAKGYQGYVLTLSATPTEEARKVAMNAGADAYLTKPLNIEQFTQAMLRAALGSRER